MSGVKLPEGFSAAGVHCGLKKNDALDLALLLADRAYPAAAMFTRNRLLGAHVHLCREHLEQSGGRVRAVIVNARNANCATGPAGVEDARRVCRELAERVGCPPVEVLMMSTGVIGARLPVDRICDHLDPLLAAASAESGRDFARAIMTTDTHEKVEVAECGPGVVTGFAKGAGMIHPDMATMLSFLLTDVTSGPPRAVLPPVVERTFHRVTIDGDTSPNDTVLLWSSLRHEVPEPALRTSASTVAAGLARQIAGDGEGATRLVTIRVHGAPSELEAAQVGRVIATSPLVKTAIAGRDPNWGRIVSAAGRAGVAFDADRATLSIGGAVVYREGTPQPAAEAEAHRHLEQDREIQIDLNLANGAREAEVWTCDLTEEYVRVNADYRT